MDNIKDFILYNLKLDNSEQFLGTIKQPENACPHAENFIQKLDLREKELLILKTKLVDIPTMSLSSKEIYNYYVNQIDSAIESISEQISQIDFIKEEIEGWRTRCLNARVMYSDMKKDFWICINNNKKDNWLSFNEISPYEKDREVCFELDSIVFNKLETNCSFFHENFGFLDQELLIIDLTPMKSIYLDLYVWGNQLTQKINQIMNQNNSTIWNLFLDDQCVPDSDGIIIRKPEVIDPSRTYISFTNVADSISYILKNGLPTFISFDHDLADKNVSGYNLAKFIVEYDMQFHCMPNEFDYQVHSANPIGTQNIIGLFSSYLKSK